MKAVKDIGATDERVKIECQVNNRSRNLFLCLIKRNHLPGLVYRSVLYLMDK